jgi:hypothetical protein
MMADLLFDRSAETSRLDAKKQLVATAQVGVCLLKLLRTYLQRAYINAL